MRKRVMDYVLQPRKPYYFFGGEAYRKPSEMLARAWNLMPELVYFAFLSTGALTFYFYKRHIRAETVDNSQKYRQHYSVYRSDDPEVKYIIPHKKQTTN